MYYNTYINLSILSPNALGAIAMHNKCLLLYQELDFLFLIKMIITITAKMPIK